jgi:hypothetical protein
MFAQVFGVPRMAALRACSSVMFGALVSAIVCCVGSGVGWQGLRSAGCRL